MSVRSKVVRVTSLALAIAVVALGAGRVGAEDGKAKKRKQAAARNASDGKTRGEPTDAPSAVVREAAKESIVRLTAEGLARVVDESINNRIIQEKVSAAPLAGDAEFLRRVSLDITGVIPTSEKAAEFVDNKDPAKRAKLIDELLESSDFGRHLADIWQDLLTDRDSTNRLLTVEPLVDWLADGFNSGKPWDKMVTELLTATGTQEQNGAATFFISNRTPDKLNDKVCQLFLGVSLQCAQCHNHPFTGYKRTEYWGMAAFFSKVRAGGKKVGKGPPEVVNEDGRGRGLPLPESALEVPPKFLGAEEPKLDSKEPYRPALAHWLTSNENPYFAKAMVNRMWAQFFGRGLVNPIENIDSNNPPSHPELFDALTQQFAANGFDLKFLVRSICNSQAYQRASIATDDSASEDSLYARMAIKPMTAEQLYDSLAQILGTPDKGRGQARRPVAAKRGQAAGTREEFVAFFQSAEGADPTEYAAGIPQVLRLMNSPQMNGGASLLKELIDSGRSPGENIERLYLTTLSRRPTDEECQRLAKYFESHKSEIRAAYGDILWALLNSSEFALNH